MSAAVKREGITDEIFRVEDDASMEEDSAFSAETRVGEQAYQAIAQLMSFGTTEGKAVETLPPPSLESAAQSGVRARVPRETPTVPAPPMPSGAEVSDEPPLEQTQLLVTSAAGPSVVPMSPGSSAREKKMDPITLPSMLGPLAQVSANPVAITVVESPLPAIVEPAAIAEAPRARWRLWSIETLIFALAFSATVGCVLATAWFILARR